MCWVHRDKLSLQHTGLGKCFFSTCCDLEQVNDNILPDFPEGISTGWFVKTILFSVCYLFYDIRMMRLTGAEKRRGGEELWLRFLANKIHYLVILKEEDIWNIDMSTKLIVLQIEFSWNFAARFLYLLQYLFLKLILTFIVQMQHFLRINPHYVQLKLICCTFGRYATSMYFIVYLVLGNQI